jgi:ubiquinone/menaquinone biosynthesis C-methylase UbiE
MTQDNNNIEVSPKKIQDDMWAGLGTQALLSAIELDIFSVISEGNRTVADIARRAKAKSRGTRMLLDGLVGLGYLNKKGEKYGLEPVSDSYLVRGKDAYMGDMVMISRVTHPAWLQLTEIIKTGKPAQAVDAEGQGKDFFPKIVGALFPGNYNASRTAQASLPSKTRSSIKRVLDVAAGSGAWSIPFAKAGPDVKVTVIDFREITSVTRKFAEKFAVAEQYDYIERNLRETDFGKSIYDLVILGHIIHSEGEKWGRQLIKKAYRALKPGGLLLIGEMVPNDTRSGPLIPVLFGLNMLVNTAQGDVFTMKEYRQWLKGAGFKKVSTIQAPAPSPLILATK